MLAIVASHPIQYQTPIWRALTQRARIPVQIHFFCDHGLEQRLDPEFGRSFAWDIDLLEGYDPYVVHPGRSPGGFNSLHVSPAMVARTRRIKPKAVWIQGWQIAGYWEIASVARALGAEIWLRGETNLRSGSMPDSLLRRMALKALFSMVARFLYIGEANRAFYRSFGVSDDALVFAPYCVDNTRFATAASCMRERRQEIRRGWGIPDDAFCFLFAGKFVPKKRPLDIIAAAKKASAFVEGRKLHLLWVGEGPLLEPARAELDAEVRCTDQVGASFIGFLNQSEIVNAYCAADCLILPSEANETWGLVVNEAMACGLPAIISDACGCASDLRIDGYDDLVYPCGDTTALARSMASATRRLPSTETLSRKINDYDVHRTVEAIETLYLSAFG